MRAKTPPFKPFETKEERESSIKHFILSSLDDSACGREDALALLARSPTSPVVGALLALSDELGERRIGAHIVLAGGATAREDEIWSLSFSARFVHEIRLTGNPRVLDAHEQLIVGDRSVWFGDCMRRDPMKRDAFASQLMDDCGANRGSRFTFGQLWSGAQSIYRSPAVASVVVAPMASAVTGSGADEAGSGACPSDDLATAVSQNSTLVETLAAWQPLTRH